MTSSKLSEYIEQPIQDFSYRTHAALEEQVFLPLSQVTLGRNANHMSALGLSLHLRHTPLPVKGYI